MREAFGGLSTDWEEGINWPAVREWRRTRAGAVAVRRPGAWFATIDGATGEVVLAPA